MPWHPSCHRVKTCSLFLWTNPTSALDPLFLCLTFSPSLLLTSHLLSSPLTSPTSLLLTSHLLSSLLLSSHLTLPNLSSSLLSSYLTLPNLSSSPLLSSRLPPSLLTSLITSLYYGSVWFISSSFTRLVFSSAVCQKLFYSVTWTWSTLTLTIVEGHHRRMNRHSDTQERQWLSDCIDVMPHLQDF